MRIVSVLLATALVAALNAQLTREALGTSYKFPDGLPNGAIVTLFFWHKDLGAVYYRDEVHVNFYDKAVVHDDKEANDRVFFRLERDKYRPVTSNTFVNGGFKIESNPGITIDDTHIKSSGWWKLDVIKLDSKRFAVYFLGFWTGVRTFGKSLDNIRSVYITSKYVGHDTAQIIVKLPNSNIGPSLVDQFLQVVDNGEDRNVTSFPNFPIGSHIAMYVALFAPHELYQVTPTLVFSGTKTFFMKIFQLWRGSSPKADPTLFDRKYKIFTHHLYLTETDERTDPANDKNIEEIDRDSPVGVKSCSNLDTRPNGQLVHLNLTRISMQEVKLELLERSIALEVKQITCNYTLSLDLAELMNEPFDIVSQHGAFIFHLEHSIPMPANATEKTETTTMKTE